MNGSCQCTGLECGDQCVPPNDPANCGGCGISCGPNQACCSATCTELSTDSKNCGFCGAMCAPGSECSYSMCWLDAGADVASEAGADAAPDASADTGADAGQTGDAGPNDAGDAQSEASLP